MTIQELADAHVGHPEEIGEDSVITAQRESFKWGALKVLQEIADIVKDARFYSDLSTSTIAFRLIKEKIKELKGEL